MIAGIQCECGKSSGVSCAVYGPVTDADFVTVEWVPEHLRASHVAAGNRGVYPHNGSERLRVYRKCAEHMVESDGDWCAIVEAP
jgi:hypothetical protein